MPTGCNQESCTVAVTGACVLSNDPKTCPHRIATEAAANADVSALVAPLKSPTKNPQFPLSLTLTPTQARAMMGERYCTIVGILGDPNAGKTAALVSLYLLVSRARLAGFSFADCRSIMAFNEISQRARDWNDGKIPDQLTVHTDLADDRSAGFLHLRLVREDRSEPVDFLLPDLPGEWSQDMVDKKRVDRLEFLKAADVVWLMMDGTQLSQASTRQYALHRMRLLMQRLAELVVPSPPVILVLTHLDQGEVAQQLIEPLRNEARLRNFDMTVVQVASFADAGTVAPGFGLADLIAATCQSAADSTPCWPVSADIAAEERAMMRFRRQEQVG